VLDSTESQDISGHDQDTEQAAQDPAIEAQNLADATATDTAKPPANIGTTPPGPSTLATG
jgi:hypothetical protein